MQSKKDVRKTAKIRNRYNRYNQVPHLTQGTNGKVSNSQLDIKNESQEVRTIYKYITLVHPPQCFLRALSRGGRMLRG